MLSFLAVRPLVRLTVLRPSVFAFARLASFRGKDVEPPHLAQSNTVKADRSLSDTIARYAEGGDLKAAERLIEQQSSKLLSDSALGAMMSAYLGTEQASKSVELLQKMEERGLATSSSMYNFLVPELARRGHTDLAATVFRGMIDRGVQPTEATLGLNLEKPQPVREMTAEEAKQFRVESGINVKGTNIPSPARTFSELSFPLYLQKQLANFGYDKPSPIQSQGIPVAIAGRDLIGLAETGSGKTMAYLLPALMHAKQKPAMKRGDGPVALILAPTRELCVQIGKEASRFTGPAALSHVCLYGGAGRMPQIAALHAGVDAIFATPGRLLDLLREGHTNLRRVSYFVLDEADRMLDMGFEPQIRDVMTFLEGEIQTLMFSATWPPEIQQLASQFFTDPVQIHVGSLGLAANTRIQHHFELVQQYQKTEKTIELLSKLEAEHQTGKILVFAGTKRACDELVMTMQAKGLRAAALHGDKSQNIRDSTLDMFRAGRVPILVATDVAARGLDVKDIKAVINYDFPNNLEDYVHRIGRTARAGSHGDAFSMFTPEAYRMVTPLIELLRDSKQEIPDTLIQLAARANPVAHTPHRPGQRFGGFRPRSPDSYSRSGSYSGGNSSGRGSGSYGNSGSYGSKSGNYGSSGSSGSYGRSSSYGSGNSGRPDRFSTERSKNNDDGQYPRTLSFLSDRNNTKE